MLKTLFNKVAVLKAFSCEYREILKNSSFSKTPVVVSSELMPANSPKLNKLLILMPLINFTQLRIDASN